MQATSGEALFDEFVAKLLDKYFEYIQNACSCSVISGVYSIAL